MSKLQKKFKPYFPYVLPSFLLFYIFYVAKYYFILFQTIKQPLVLVLIPTWLFSILLLSKNKIMGYSISKKIKEKIVLYSLFITFLISYNLIFSSNLPLILAQTPQQCVDDSDCGPGLTCLNGVCTECECSKHSDCSTGVCSTEEGYECRRYYPKSCDGCVCIDSPVYVVDDSCTNLCESEYCKDGECVPATCKLCGFPTFGGCWRKMKDNNCNDIDWYDFAGATPSGRACGIGPSHISHLDYMTLWGAWCPSSDAIWKKIDCYSWPSGSEGDICKIWWVDISGIHAAQGYFDPDDKACIINCDGKKEAMEGYDKDYCGSSSIGDGRCEEACGAPSECDEEYPNSYHDTDGDGYTELYCTSGCEANFCNVNSECDKGSLNFVCYNDVDSSGNGHWNWGLVYSLDEDGSPWQECFDGYDNDCDGKRDCVDDRCRRVKNPETGDVCCQTDDDCPIRYNVKGKCVDNICKWERCRTDNDCPSGQKCYCGVCSATFTSAGCDENECCNREYGGTGVGDCVNEGHTYNNKYLCISSQMITSSGGIQPGV